MKEVKTGEVPHQHPWFSRPPGRERRDLGWNTCRGALSMISRDLGDDRWEKMCILMDDPFGRPEIVVEYAGLRNGGPDAAFIGRMHELWRRTRSEGVPVTFRPMKA